MASPEDIKKSEEQQCRLCGSGFKPNTSAYFIPTCGAYFGVWSDSKPGLCMFKPEHQYICRFFEEKATEEVKEETSAEKEG